jgi:hypothetical protein
MASEVEELAEAFGLLAADRDLGLFFVVHFQHEGRFEPGHDFLNVVDIDQIGAVRTPEGVGVEGVEEVIERAIVGGAFGVFGSDGDEAALDGRKNKIAGIDKKHALLGADQDFRGLRRGRFGGSKLVDELFQALGGAGLRFDFAFHLLDGSGDAGFVEGLQDVVDGVHIEGLHGVMIERGGEDNVRNFEFALDQFLEDAEAVQAGHLDIEEHQVGGVLFDEIDSFEPVFAECKHINFGKGFKKKCQLFARRFLVVDDDGVDRHGRRTS